MPYFSRLTDIVTCNLSSLLASVDDPAKALDQIILEMNEGVAGAERSVRTAINNVARIESEIGEQRAEAGNWVGRAQQALLQENDDEARQSLLRKHEAEDLIAGLEQQLQAAVATRDHLQTMLGALQARLADAHRRLNNFDSERRPAAAHLRAGSAAEPDFSSTRIRQVDAELEELRRQLKQRVGGSEH